MKKVLNLILTAAMLVGINPFGVYAEEIGNDGSDDSDVSGYTYIVNNMEFCDVDYEYSEVPVTGGEVSVTVTKRADKETDASLIVSTYTDAGKMLGMYDVGLDELMLGDEMTAYFELSASDGYEVSKVRAYVWEGFNSTVPLSNVCSEDNPNEIEDPCVEEIEIEIPPVYTDFSDIPPESDYAMAVKMVAELGIMNGYEDGNFYPEHTITKAEAAYLTVKIAGRQRTAEFLKAEEYFVDVPADHWAAAAVNYCYAKGYLVTEGANFGPEKFISATEFIKMLVDIMGYSLYAEAEGGYPVGYICVADDMGLFDGLNIKDYSSLKRREVAFLISNAINVPIAEKVYIGYENGEISYNVAVMNGVNGYYYKSLLTKVYNAYLVEGNVVANYKTGYMIPDEIEFEIVKTENYEEYDFGINYPPVTVWANIGETDPAMYDIGNYLRAIIRIDNNNDYVILSVVDLSSGRNKEFEFDCSLLDTSNYEDSDGCFISGAFASTSDDFIMVDTDGVLEEYRLKTDYSGEIDVDLYVNGAPIYSATREEIEEYVLCCGIGNIKLVDTYKTDGYYDTIHVDFYATAAVERVIASTGKVYLEQDKGAPNGTIILNDEDEDLVYSISLDGEEISVADLNVGDILSIAYDVTAGSSQKVAFADSSFYEIYVSRATASGKVTRRNSDEGTVVVADETYEFVGGYSALTLASEYVLTLDYFGRIYDYEIGPTSVKYAIIDKAVYTSSEEAYKVTLYTVDGVAKVYVFDGTDSEAKAMMDNTYTTVTGFASTGYIGNGKKEVEERVVEYTVSSSTGKLTSVKFLTAGESTVVGEDETDEYEERYSRIGNIKMSSATKLIDVIDYKDNSYKSYSDIKVADLSVLVDGTEYEAYAFGIKKDGTYPYVLIVSGSIEKIVTGYAVINEFNAESDGIYCAEMYSITDDDYISYAYDGSAEGAYIENGVAVDSEDCNQSVLSRVYDSAGNKTDIVSRIVKYTVNTTLETIIELDFLSAIEQSESAYNKTDMSVGNILIGSNGTFVDAVNYVGTEYSEYVSLGILTEEYLAEGNIYSTFAFGAKDALGRYPVVLITQGEYDNSMRYAIIDRIIYSSSEEAYKVTLYTVDGVAKVYVFDGTDSEAKAMMDNTYTTVTGAASTGYIGNGKKAVEDRVIEYTVSSSTGELISVNFLSVVNGMIEEYDEKNLRIGSVKMSTATKIIDAVEYVTNGYKSYSDLAITTTDSLIDRAKYEAYAYGTKFLDGTYPLVLIVGGMAEYNATTSFAVITGTVEEAIDENDEYIYMLPVLYNSEAIELTVSEDVGNVDVTKLKRGDVIFFQNGKSGYVEKIDLIFSFGGAPMYSDLVATLVEGNDEAVLNAGIVTYPTDDYGYLYPDFVEEWYTTYSDAIQLVFGPVMYKDSSSFSLGTITNDDEYGLVTYRDRGISNAGGCYEIDISPDINVYVYDYSQTHKNYQLTIGSTGEILQSIFSNANNADDGDTILWDYKDYDGNYVNKESINFAFAKVVDGKATDIFVFLAK